MPVLFGFSQEILTKSWSRNLDKNPFYPSQIKINSDADMRKTAATITLIMTLIITAAAGTQFINLVNANPIVSKRVPTPIGTKQPTISIFSLKNDSAYASNNVSLIFNVSIAESKYTNLITSVYYKVDWHEGEIYVYSLNVSAPVSEQNHIKEYSCNRTLIGIPEGNHSVSISVIANGGYYEGGYYYYFYNFGSSLVNFIVDTTLPIVSSVSVENKTYDTSNVPLNFIVNESASQFSYILNGQENTIINGNTTLTGLSNGFHNITVYACDMAGNIGTSETIIFAVAKPESLESFPVVPIATASAVVAVAVGAGLLVYFKKHRPPK